MMRHLHSPKAEISKQNRVEPMAEGIVLLNANKRRDWKSMDDKEVLEFARRFIEEKGIRKRKGLENADNGLYRVLRRKDLLDKMEFEDRRGHREWGTDAEVLDFARRLIEDKGIRNRKGLAKADSGLYQVLRTKKLLDQVFAPIDHDKHKAAVQGVLDAMDSFGDDR